MFNVRASIIYEEFKTAGVSDYTKQTPPKHFGYIKCRSLRALKIRKYLINAHKIEDAHVQCISNHYVKFEY